ncbi:GNAT family N-acetyltransferase [Roseibium hamelinense]|nr:GNAT family N-acetyltransferase [Roseibium hamelinense]
MTAAGNILNAWIDETAWMPRVHSHQSVIDYYQTHVFRHCDVFVGVDSEHCVMGFLAIDTDDLITALYLARAARGRELGRQLLDHVKTERARDLSLWTFEANSGARAFYHREGFQEVRRTKGDNEEHLPDILYRWTAAGKPA